MSQLLFDVLEDPSVNASLQRGPSGKVRLTFECPSTDLLRDSLGAHRYPDPVIEIDAAKLRTLRFSEQELAEIGFSLLTRLSALVRVSSIDRDA